MTKNDYLMKLETVKKAADAYYNHGQIIMTDGEYDQLFNEVVSIEAENPDWVTGENLENQVGAGVSAPTTNDTVKYSRPMLSLKNTYNVEEITKFLEKFTDYDTEFQVEAKYDGTAASALYVDGKLQYVASRGTGTVGENYSNASVTISGLPDTIPAMGNVEIRGEIIFTAEDFDKANAIRVENGKTPFINPRNGVSGAMKATGRDYLLPVTFYGYDVEPVNMNAHADLESYGVNHEAPTITNLDGVMSALKDVEARMVTEVLPMDGAVVKVVNQDVRDEFGEGSHSPRWAVAYKFPIKEVETIIEDVTWATGVSGVITPRAVIKPVTMLGSTTRFVTLHNLKFIRDRDLMLNDPVLFYKAGYVIPRINGRLDVPRTGVERPILIPANCPACDSVLNVNVDVLRCENTDCDNAARRITYAASRKALDIEGLGETTAENLTTVLGLESFDQIFDLTEQDLLQLPKSGERSAQKLIAEIKKARGKTFDQFFTALSLRQAGSSLASEFGAVAGDLKGLLTMTEADINGVVRSVGDKKAATVINSIKQNKSVIEGLVNRGINPKAVAVETVEGILDGAKFLLTGKATGVFEGKSRGDVEKLIVSQGGAKASSVSSKLDYLVSSESGTSKMVKAEKLGVKIISFEELADMMNMN